jgi:hypothetical protein
MYEFTITNPPSIVYTTMKISNILEVDYNVKQFMQSYGINNVRGGSYSEEFLPDYVIKTLSRELGYNTDKYNETSIMIDDIVKKYSTNDWIIANVEKGYFKDLPKCISDSITLELKRLQLEMDKYVFTQTKYELIKYHGKGNRRFEINKDLQNDIKWLHNRVINDVSTFANDKTQYKSVLNKLNVIYNEFIKIKEEYPKYTPICNIEHPEFIFDKLFLHKIPQTECSINAALEIVEVFEYMLNFIICELDQYEFTINEYPPNYFKSLLMTYNYLTIDNDN